MEARDGAPARLQSQAPALPLPAQMASALAHLHRHGVAHMDVKPDNIYLQVCPSWPVLPARLPAHGWWSPRCNQIVACCTMLWLHAWLSHRSSPLPPHPVPHPAGRARGGGRAQRRRPCCALQAGGLWAGDTAGPARAGRV